MGQLAIPFAEDDSLEGRFAAFHRANPEVYRELVRLARVAKGAGKKRIGVKMLWEVMRWNVWIQTQGDPAFKLNNSFTSRYARLIARRESDLANLFEVRELRS